MYRVRDLMTKEIVTVNADNTVRDASKVMAEKSGGYAIVLRTGKPVGMVTERDLVWKVMAKGINPSKIKISEIMATPLITIDPDADLGMATEIMKRHQIRTLPVVRYDTLYGIITAIDIINNFDEYVKKAIIEATWHRIFRRMCWP